MANSKKPQNTLQHILRDVTSFIRNKNTKRDNSGIKPDKFEIPSCNNNVRNAFNLILNSHNWAGKSVIGQTKRILSPPKRKFGECGMYVYIFFELDMCHDFMILFLIGVFSKSGDKTRNAELQRSMDMIKGIIYIYIWFSGKLMVMWLYI